MVPVGEVGELYVRGPVVMRGYWNRPEATAETLVDGWLRTGDLGTRDAEGDIRIVDREKDLIIRGGYNVYPREVEEVLHEHPDIIEVAVVGVPDEHFGEEVAAVMAMRPGAALEPADLRAWARRASRRTRCRGCIRWSTPCREGRPARSSSGRIDRAEVRAAAVFVGAAAADSPEQTAPALELVLAERREPS